MKAELNVDILHLLLAKYEDLFHIVYKTFFPFHTDLFLTLVVWSLFSMISSFAYSMKWQSSLCLENVLWFKRTLIYCFEIKNTKTSSVAYFWTLNTKMVPLFIIKRIHLYLVTGKNAVGT